MEARSDYRRDPAADRRPKPSRASSSPSDPASVCGMVRGGIGYRNGQPVMAAGRGGGAPGKHRLRGNHEVAALRMKIGSGVHGVVSQQRPSWSIR